jgi:hypothetical protein
VPGIAGALAVVPGRVQAASAIIATVQINRILMGRI